MSAEVVPLRVQTAAPTAEQLLGRIRAMASDSRHVRFDHPHFRDQLRKRGVNMRQVLETVRKGIPVGKPRLDQCGDWRVKLRRKAAGRTVQVVAAVKVDHFVAVTVI
jgi:hypothetical protein